METKFIPRKSRLAALKKAPPWTVKLAKVDGGYLAFRNLKAYQTWKEEQR